MRIHFIAIGGAVMHNLALALHNEGHTVTGSDDEIFEPSKSRLEEAGLLPPETGWFPERITANLDAVILGMHARNDNPELQYAREQGLKIYSFPEYVYEHAKNKKRIVIAGSHGKTSITSMVMHVLKKLDMPFDYLVGSHVEGFETMVQLKAESPVIIIEGDEYLTSALDPTPKFLWYKPHVAVISGIAWDHANVFPDKEVYHQQFVDFIRSVNPTGQLIFNKDDETLQQCIDAAQSPVHSIPYQAAPYTVQNNKTVISHNNQQYELLIFGRHNMYNMEAARLICNGEGISDAVFYDAMTSFAGAGMRLEKWFDQNGFLVFRDFAHSPSKLKATIESVKEQYADKELIAVFELHTYSSLSKGFLEEYRHCTDEADELVIVYDPCAFAAKKLEPFDESFIASVFDHQKLTIADNQEAFMGVLEHIVHKNRVLLFMSSGNFFNLPVRNMIHQHLNKNGN